MTKPEDCELTGVLTRDVAITIAGWCEAALSTPVVLYNNTDKPIFINSGDTTSCTPPAHGITLENTGFSLEKKI
jgi:hypothetical protein